MVSPKYVPTFLSICFPLQYEIPANSEPNTKSILNFIIWVQYGISSSSKFLGINSEIINSPCNSSPTSLLLVKWMCCVISAQTK